MYYSSTSYKLPAATPSRPMDRSQYSSIYTSHKSPAATLPRPFDRNQDVDW